jgi:hypothetical protein
LVRIHVSKQGCREEVREEREKMQIPGYKGYKDTSGRGLKCEKCGWYFEM